MKWLASFVSVAAAAATLQVAEPRVALACGGCFSPPETVTAVESHRMVIALSTERTTLWDQIRYSGDPDDFVWVLPVPSGAATIELADPLFFDEIDTFTSPVLSPPPLTPPDCPPPPWDDDGFPPAPPAPGSANDAGAVDVFREETVGPYETVTLASTSPTALRDWLVDHGYSIPEATLPTIAYYVETGSAFIVMRLAPTKEVDAMQPVRVRYPGYMATFPLRMVTVGAVGSLDMSLFVIAEQRYEAMNYATVQISADDLVWNWDTFASNYGQAFRDAIDGAGGAAWITEFAAPLYYVPISTQAELEIAVVGHEYPYLTRLRTSILVDHISDDLELAPALDASDVSQYLQISQSIGTQPNQQCPDWNGDGQPDTWEEYEKSSSARARLGCEIGAGSRGAAGVIAAGIVLILLALRRRRRA